jgi:hypothetical protein
VAPLHEHLAAFVPLEIRELQRQGGPTEWHFEEAQRRWHKLQEDPDTDSSILMSGHRKGLAPKTIARLVEYLAIMAFVPGGVKYGPLHFWPNREKDLRDMEAS